MQWALQRRQLSVDYAKCSSPPPRCQCRSKSAGRTEACDYLYNNYFISDFNCDGSPVPSPIESLTRELYYPEARRTDLTIRSGSIQQADRFVPIQNLYNIDLVCQDYESDDRRRSHAHRGQTRGHCGDPRLRRKNVFVLHEEVKVSPSSAKLEEISDTDKIIEMCQCTLKSMMASKKHRKFLHHMNNNSMACYDDHIYTSMICRLDGSNNADTLKKKQMVERVFGVNMAKPANLETIMAKDKSQSKESKGKGPSRYRIDGLLAVSKLDRFDQESENAGATTQQADVQSPSKGSIRSESRSMRRDSIRIMESKMQGITPSTSRVYTVPSPARSRGYSRAVPRFSTMSETTDKRESDADLALLVDNQHLSQKELALKLLSEIQAKIDKRKQSEDERDIDPGAMRTVRQITPQEALQCAWLRLSKEQIATLEALIRQQGIDPGIHAHSDVSEYDVFAEVREIRRKEKVLKEEEEQK